jgi:hypothetical protein
MGGGRQGRRDIGLHQPRVDFPLFGNGRALAKDHRLDGVRGNRLNEDREAPQDMPCRLAVGERADDPDLLFVGPLIGLGTLLGHGNGRARQIRVDEAPRAGRPIVDGDLAVEEFLRSVELHHRTGVLISVVGPHLQRVADPR